MNKYILLITFISYNIIHSQTNDKKYKLVLEDGIFVEQFNLTNRDEMRFTENNSTYIEGNQFTYNYNHTSIDGLSFYFKYDEYGDWAFTPIDSIDTNTITQVKISVMPGLSPMIQINPNYNQTIIKFNYYSQNDRVPFGGSSGVIENEKNIWVHPPRDKYFKILELNPFPFIKAPFEIGNKWSWQLEIGDFWSDHRWKIWKGNIVNNYEYMITGKKEINTLIGKIDCYIIVATAKSRLGETHLTSYFNAKYGFVKLNYTNIDGSNTNLTLVKFEEKK